MGFKIQTFQASNRITQAWSATLFRKSAEIGREWSHEFIGSHRLLHGAPSDRSICLMAPTQPQPIEQGVYTRRKKFLCIMVPRNAMILILGPPQKWTPESCNCQKRASGLFCWLLWEHEVQSRPSHGHAERYKF